MLGRFVRTGIDYASGPDLSAVMVVGFGVVPTLLGAIERTVVAFEQIGTNAREAAASFRRLGRALDAWEATIADQLRREGRRVLGGSGATARLRKKRTASLRALGS